MKLKSALKRGREMILALHRLIHTKDYWLRNKDTINNNLTYESNHVKHNKTASHQTNQKQGLWEAVSTD